MFAGLVGVDRFRKITKLKTRRMLFKEFVLVVLNVIDSRSVTQNHKPWLEDQIDR